MGIAGDAARQQPVLACLTDSVYHVGRSARGGNAYHGVVLYRMMRLQVFPALFGYVLGPLYRMPQGLVATRNNARHPVCRHSERWRQFAGIQHP